MVYPWGFESLPRIKKKAHGLAIDRGLFLCFPTKAANKTAGPDSIQGPAVLCMQEKGLEPSLTGNWCLKPARLPFRHSCTENLFSLSIFVGNVNSSACFLYSTNFQRVISDKRYCRSNAICQGGSGDGFMAESKREDLISRGSSASGGRSGRLWAGAVLCCAGGARLPGKRPDPGTGYRLCLPCSRGSPCKLIAAGGAGSGEMGLPDL